MSLSKKIKIISVFVILGLLVYAVVSIFQSGKSENIGKLKKNFEEKFTKAEGFRNNQLDSALLYAHQAFKLVQNEPSLELQMKSSILLMSEVKFLRSGASDGLYKKVEKCENWFRKKKMYQKAFNANLFRLEIKTFLRGSHNVTEDVNELIELANSSKSNQALAKAYYFKMSIRDYTRKWEDDVQILDSARMFAYKAGDSVLLAKIRIMSVLPVNGSDAAIDSTHASLKQAISWNNSDLKCLSYDALGMRFAPSRELDSALFYYKKGIKESDQFGSSIHKMHNRCGMGVAYMYSFKFDDQLKNAVEALRLARKTQNRFSERRVLDDISGAWMKKSEYSKSITPLIKAMKIAKQTNSKQGVFTLQKRLMTLLTKTKRFEEADEIYNEMLRSVSKKEINEANDIDRALVFYLKGHLERTKKNLDSALFFYQKGIDYFGKYDEYGIKRFYLEESVLLTLLEQKRYEKAEEKYKYIIKSFVSLSARDFQFLHLKGQLLFHLGRLDEAITALESSLEKGKGAFLEIHYKSCFTLSTIYEKRGNNAKALYYSKKGVKIKSDFDEKSDDLKLERLQSEYKLSLKETEIQKLDIERLEQKNKLKSKENSLQTRRFYIIFLCILLLLFVVIAISISRRAKDAIVKKDWQRRTLEKERQIERLKTEESQRSIDLKNQLFANISHEFRTPLTLINAPVEELMDKVDDEIKKPLEIVKRNADHLLVMVDEILELSRLDSGDAVLSKKSFELNSFIRNLQMNFEPIFRQNNIEFSIDLPKEPYRITGDEYRLKMVMNNLLKNAFHHTPREGVITVRVEAKKEEGELVLEVFNSGEWIDENFLPSIFDRYARSKEKEYSGYGIGLSFCKKMISLHEGNITAQNVEKGVLLSFSFPTNFELGEPKSMITEAVEYTFESNSEKNINSENTLLIVEDNSEVRSLLTDILSSEYNVIVADNGEEGIKKAKEDQPDLIISDVMMPKVGGIELTSTLKDNFSTSHIPIILLTAKSTGHDRISGLETGADDYLTKPFSPKELRVRVKNLIQQREKLQKRFSKNVFLMPEEITSNSLDQEFLMNATKIVEENLSNSEFNVEQFCRKLALNRNSVHQKLKTLTGNSSSHFIKSIKLKKAATLLADERITIIEVSELSGFNNRQAFYKAFKEQFEVTPSAYRKNCLSKNC